MKKLILLSLAVASLTGCSIKQSVTPVSLSTKANLCVVENPAVREGFLHEFEGVLASKGIRYRVIQPSADQSSCEWVARYSANWAWDLALYMVYAEIKVYRDNKLDGEAIYDARMGGANMNKFIDAEPKIRELVEQLIQQKQAYAGWSDYYVAP